MTVYLRFVVLPCSARTPFSGQIERAAVDVLVDYDGLHDFNNVVALGLHPAPLQVRVCVLMYSLMLL